MKDWIKVYKTPILSRAEIVKGVLISRGIEAVVMNKKDTTLIINNGMIEVLVPNDQALTAANIVEDEITFK